MTFLIGVKKMALSLGLATGLLVPMAFAQGVVQRDTGGLNMGGVNAINKVGAGVTQPAPNISADGVSGVNAVNKVGAGVTQPAPRISADGVNGVNAINRMGAGVTQRPGSIQADVPRNDTMFAISPTGSDMQMKRMRP
ncbi:MAG: hypothetical protein EON60_12820 [Alphaproteobacteria bacterium]|nr:MAG: hypothetical protein EON60_12820 [Alphaproteobacteria bacterium]